MRTWLAPCLCLLACSPAATARPAPGDVDPPAAPMAQGALPPSRAPQATDEPCIDAHELAVRGQLRTLSAAEAILQTSHRLDRDGDGNGEYGFLADLLGTSPPSALPGLEIVGTDVHDIQHGYRVRIWLPGVDRDAADPGRRAAVPRIDAERAEQAWCAYAWPQHPGRSGRHTFYVDHTGTIWRTDAGDRYGDTRGPAAAAALPRGTRAFAGIPRPRIPANDGLVWARAD